jgi:hypothetical protein
MLLRLDELDVEVSFLEPALFTRNEEWDVIGIQEPLEAKAYRFHRAKLPF